MGEHVGGEVGPRLTHGELCCKRTGDTGSSSVTSVSLRVSSQNTCVHKPPPSRHMASPGSRRLPHTGQRDDRVGGVVGSGGG